MLAPESSLISLDAGVVVGGVGCSSAGTAQPRPESSDLGRCCCHSRWWCWLLILSDMTPLLLWACRPCEPCSHILPVSLRFLVHTREKSFGLHCLLLILSACLFIQGKQVMLGVREEEPDHVEVVVTLRDDEETILILEPVGRQHCSHVHQRRIAHQGWTHAEVAADDICLVVGLLETRNHRKRHLYISLRA